MSRSTENPRQALERSRSSLTHYQTFPTAPPKSSGRRLTDDSGTHDEESPSPSPLPLKQLAVLAFIALAEQTAFNSISPYLPAMVLTFPNVEKAQVGMYCGVIGSAFALAQFTTSFFWGRLSDRIGRKPVIMLGTLLSALCFLAFGFSTRLWHAVLSHVALGLFNGNAVIVSACLGEITDKSNQSRAFTYLPVVYGIGGITGPAVGGLLVMYGAPFPYLAPNVVATATLLVDFVVITLCLDETLEEAKAFPPLGERAILLYRRVRNSFQSSAPRLRPHRSTDSSDVDSDDEYDSEGRALLSSDLYANGADDVKYSDIMSRDTVLLLASYLIFQLGNISFNALYPIFAAAEPPAGRDLSPAQIGLSLAFSGVVTIIFQVAVFGRLKEKLGNRASFRLGIFGFVLAMLLMPFVGYKDSRPPFGVGNATAWLWVELGFVLLIKTVAAVGGLTSALLLITNSAPNPSVLGTLNGLAQTLSAAGRAIGPFISGSLFSLATGVRPKGEALAWGVFAGISFVGFVASFGIRSESLESDDWENDDDDRDDDDDDLEADSA